MHQKKVSNIKIHYSKRRTLPNLILGITWVLFGITYFFISAKVFLVYGYLLLGTPYLIFFYYEKRFGYLTITKKRIIKQDNPFYKKQINTEEIKAVGKVYDDYILKTENNKMRINTSFIDSTSKLKLDAFINDLKAKLELKKNEAIL